ncbi:hypothetical protein NE236_28780 [Actinoallomurus purpureus]|uniref:hypothetical protein n=1 Tax=Actinoallomurus purpureus TaxID=478114 RepID=UPI0020936C9C|nr:hypothetical protein [Actinoallomurus purpureus]MCO6008976.1 hypothetical protein [Actinoallomurus purpureus]
MNEGPGCLTVPALIIVVPIRLLWELISLIGRAVGRYVLRPIGWLVYQVLIRPIAWLFRVLVVLPLRWVADTILAPLGRAVYRYLLRPIERGLAWCLAIVLLPFAYAAHWIGRGLVALWRAAWPLLAALGRGIAHVWRLAGIVLFHILVRPVRWVWRTFVRPVLRVLAWAWRVTVLRPARWLRVKVLKPAGAAVRSVFRALGLDTRRP